jgi:putative aldouronate transport system substrate-binding protein
VKEIFNIDIDFYLLPDPANDFRTKVSLMVASSDLPDLIFTAGNLTDEQILDYGTKGAFIPLNNYFNDPAKMPNFAKIPQEDKDVIFNTIYSSDGNIYAFPRYEPEIHNLTPHKMLFNTAWAKKLGFSGAPKTTDELKKMLIAFRDGDPNGNGRKDEVGIHAWYSGTYGEDTITLLLNAFIAYYKDNNVVGLGLDTSGNKVIAPFTEPEFRKGLTYLNDLFREGVLVASSFTDDQNSFRSSLNSNPPIVALTSSGDSRHWPNANQNPNFLELDWVGPVTGPDGICYVPYNGYVPAKAAFVTSKAKNRDLAVKVADIFYGQELATAARYGEPDVDYSRDPKITSTRANIYTVEGIVPAITIVNNIPPDGAVWNNPSKKVYGGTNPRYAPAWEVMTRTGYEPPFDPNLKSTRNHAVNWYYYKDAHPQYVLPRLSYSINDAVANAETISNVTAYVNQSVAEFTTGIRDIKSDAAWSAYLRELDNMGLQRWLTSAQTTYDRQRSK